MNSQLSRRTVLSFMGLAAVPTSVLAMPYEQDNQRPPPLDVELVQQFVIAGHGDLDKVKEMLAATPGLLNSTNDWGGGDFETALGGAGHMGRDDIATYLMGEGARADVFVHAMMGDLDVVKSMLTKYPNLKDSKGPHGISLLTHAKKGEERAKGVLDYLESLG